MYGRLMGISHRVSRRYETHYVLPASASAHIDVELAQVPIKWYFSIARHDVIDPFQRPSSMQYRHVKSPSPTPNLSASHYQLAEDQINTHRAQVSDQNAWCVVRKCGVTVVYTTAPHGRIPTVEPIVRLCLQHTFADLIIASHYCLLLPSLCFFAISETTRIYATTNCY